MQDFNHLILYAKRWYQRSDNVLVDLKKIFGHRCGLNWTTMSDADVWYLCVEALKKTARPEQIDRFLNDLFRSRPEENVSQFFTHACPLERAIRNILAILSDCLVVQDDGTMLDLGEPDPMVLPLVDDHALERYRKMVSNM